MFSCLTAVARPVLTPSSMKLTWPRVLFFEGGCPSPGPAPTVTSYSLRFDTHSVNPLSQYRRQNSHPADLAVACAGNLEASTDRKLILLEGSRTSPRHH